MIAIAGLALVATLASALPGPGLGAGAALAEIAGGLAAVSLLASLARLNPAYRLPPREEMVAILANTE